MTDKPNAYRHSGLKPVSTEDDFSADVSGSGFGLSGGLKPFAYMIDYRQPAEPLETSWQGDASRPVLFANRAQRATEATLASGHLDKLQASLQVGQKDHQDKILFHGPMAATGMAVTLKAVCFMRDADLRAQHKHFQQTVLGQQIRIFMGLVQGAVADQVDLKSVATMFAQPGNIAGTPGFEAESSIDPEDLIAARNMVLCAAVKTGGVDLSPDGTALKQLELKPAAERGTRLLEGAMQQLKASSRAMARPPKPTGLNR